MLAVSLHDVAPQTWPACARLLDLIDTVAGVPVTLLVVPDYHRQGLIRFGQTYRAALERRLIRGDELALHGWNHLDEMPLDRGWIDWVQRTRLTAREGEFSALSYEQSRERLQQGVDWFEAHGWPLHGFVAPAWLLGRPAREALNLFPFRYTTTRRTLDLLPQGTRWATCTLVYSVRSAWRRRLSRLWNRGQLLVGGRGERIVRVALHPHDALHPQISLHIAQALRVLLGSHEALTKAQLAERCSGGLLPGEDNRRVAALR